MKAPDWNNLKKNILFSLQKRFWEEGKERNSKTVDADSTGINLKIIQRGNGRIELMDESREGRRGRRRDEGKKEGSKEGRMEGRKEGREQGRGGRCKEEGGKLWRKEEKKKGRNGQRKEGKRARDEKEKEEYEMKRRMDGRK